MPTCLASLKRQPTGSSPQGVATAALNPRRGTDNVPPTSTRVDASVEYDIRVVGAGLNRGRADNASTFEGFPPRKRGAREAEEHADRRSCEGEAGTQGLDETAGSKQEDSANPQARLHRRGFPVLLQRCGPGAGSAHRESRSEIPWATVLLPGPLPQAKSSWDTEPCPTTEESAGFLSHARTSKSASRG